MDSLITDESRVKPDAALSVFRHGVIVTWKCDFIFKAD